MHFRGNARLLVRHLLQSPRMSASNHDIEQVLWPGQNGELGARRRELVCRINAHLKRNLGREASDPVDLPLLIESFEHMTRLNPDACRVVSDKSLTQV